MPPAVVATPPPNIARAERIKLALIKVIKSAGKNSDIKPVVVKNEMLVKQAPQSTFKT